MSGNKLKIAGLASRLTERAAEEGDAGVVVDAEAAVAELRVSYTTWVRSDLAAMRAAFEKAHADRHHGSDHLRALFEVCHNVKAQGGTFGYDLITQIGRSLCHFIDSSDDIGDGEFQVIEAHIDALRVVVREAVQGDGGEIGRQIVAGLGQAVERVLK